MLSVNLRIWSIFKILCFGLLIGFTSCHSEDEKLNVLFILADDFGYHDLGTTGSTLYQTPHLDHLASQSVRFTHGYASSRVCSPSRASIMTGLHSAGHGITDWIGARMGDDWRKHGRHDKLLPPTYQTHLKSEWNTLPEIFKDAGYATFFAGKWHLGSKGNGPQDHGFDTNIGGWEKGSPIGGYFSPWENPYLENKIPGENLSMRLAKETIEFLEQHRDTSFFAFLSFYAVHGPIQTTEEKWKKFRTRAIAEGIQDTGFRMERVLPIRVVQDNPVYAGLVEHMDDAIGMVLDRLQSLGLDKNTIIVFTSDNGGVASGDAYSTSNLPLRGGKGYQWEGGIREPYFIKSPGIISKDIDYPATGADFLPTLCDLAEIGLPSALDLDGISLKTVIEGGNLPDRSLYWHYPHYGNQGGEPSSIIRKGQYKLIHYWEDGRNELYDLISDPAEENDLAKRSANLVKSLEYELLDFLNSRNAKLPEVDSTFNAEKRSEWLAFRRDTLLPRLERQRIEYLSSDYLPNATWWGSKLVND